MLVPGRRGGGESSGLVRTAPTPAKQRISCKTARTPDTLSPSPATVTVFAASVSGFFSAPRGRWWARQPAASSHTRRMSTLRHASSWWWCYDCPSQSRHRGYISGNVSAPYYPGASVALRESTPTSLYHGVAEGPPKVYPPLIILALQCSGNASVLWHRGAREQHSLGCAPITVVLADGVAWVLKAGICPHSHGGISAGTYARPSQSWLPRRRSRSVSGASQSWNGRPFGEVCLPLTIMASETLFGSVFDSHSHGIVDPSAEVCLALKIMVPTAGTASGLQCWCPSQ